MTFQPGQSGNPAGRPRGSRNKRTILAEQILDEHAGEVTQAAIDLAKSGHGPSLRMCMDRVTPSLRHRMLDFELPAVTSAADAVVAANAILQGAARGDLTVPEAAGLLKIVRGIASLLAAADRERRAAPLRAQESAGAACPLVLDAARHDDDPINLVPDSPPGAVEPVASPESDEVDLDRSLPLARSRTRERVHHQPSPALEERDRAAWDALRSRKWAAPTGTSPELASFGAKPKTVAPDRTMHSKAA
jgi:uncharacterized protein DUF5681